MGKGEDEAGDPPALPALGPNSLLAVLLLPLRPLMELMLGR